MPRLLRQDIFVADGIGVPGLVSSILGRLPGKKSMITVHGYFGREWSQKRRGWLIYKLHGIFSRFILSTADLFVVNDEQLGQYLKDMGVAMARLFTRYVFVDTGKFSLDNVYAKQFRDLRERFGLPEKYILYVGNLNKLDGADDFLRVFQKIHKKYPGSKCLLVGYGSLKSWLESFVIKNNLDKSVFYVDWINYEQMPCVYYGAELVILPNHPPQGGVIRINLEALSMQVPVVAYDIGEIHKVIRDGETGYLVRENDVELMAERAISLLTSPELRRELGYNGRKLVQSTYDVASYLENWIQSLAVLHPCEESTSDLD